jgi:hypothetical protein
MSAWAFFPGELTLKTVATLVTVPYTIALPKRTALHQGRTATGPLTYQ